MSNDLARIEPPRQFNLPTTLMLPAAHRSRGMVKALETLELLA
jgi:hypothetical protein